MALETKLATEGKVMMDFHLTLGANHAAIITTSKIDKEKCKTTTCDTTLKKNQKTYLISSLF